MKTILPITFADGGAAAQAERPEAPAETPPGFCRCGADFNALVERLAKLESLVAGASVPANHFTTTADGIVGRVAFLLKMSNEAIRDKSRKTYVVEARTLAAARLFHLGFKQKDTAAALGWACESPVHYALKRHAAMLETLPHYRAAWKMIEKEFQQTNQPNQNQ